jgi:hypothetical protein
LKGSSVEQHWMKSEQKLAFQGVHWSVNDIRENLELVAYWLRDGRSWNMICKYSAWKRGTTPLNQEMIRSVNRCPVQMV